MHIIWARTPIFLEPTDRKRLFRCCFQLTHPVYYARITLYAFSVGNHGTRNDKEKYAKSPHFLFIRTVSIIHGRETESSSTAVNFNCQRHCIGGFLPKANRKVLFRWINVAQADGINAQERLVGEVYIRRRKVPVKNRAWRLQSVR